jgi:hypothetical protein
MATAGPVLAAYFGPVHYDPKGDQLVVTLMYDGTKPDHHFSVHWGRCRKLNHPGQPAHVIDAFVIDDQGNEVASKSFTKTIRVPLAALSCRPGRVVLIEGLDGFDETTVEIP